MSQFIALASLYFCTSISTADTVSLKKQVQVNADAEHITLSDIADLRGDFAMQFAGTIVLTQQPERDTTTISIDTIRAKLNDAGVHWGRINLSGGTVILKRITASTTPPKAMQSLTLDESAPSRKTQLAQLSEHATESAIGQSTIRGSIARLVVQHYQVDPSDLRLLMSSQLDIDSSSLHFEIQPLSNFDANRLEFAVRIWAHDKIESRHTVTVEPSIRTNTVQLARDVSRNHVILEDDIEIVSNWLAPVRAVRMVHHVSAIGRKAARSLKQGDILTESDLRRDIVVERGDAVIVRCHVGGIVISLLAEARDDASEGETIEFRKRGEREPFRARVTAPGEAILDLTHNK